MSSTWVAASFVRGLTPPSAICTLCYYMNYVVCSSYRVLIVYENQRRCLQAKIGHHDYSIQPVCLSTTPVFLFECLHYLRILLCPYCNRTSLIITSNIHLYMFAYVWYVYIHTYIYIHTHTHIYRRIHTHMYLHICIYIYIYTYICRSYKSKK